MRERRFLLAGLCALGLAAAAAAHEPWIKPSRFFLQAPGWVSFDISNSHELFVPEENPLHDLYQIELIGPDGQAAEAAPAFFSGRLRIAGEAELPKEGTYLLAESSLAPIYDTRLRNGEVLGVAKDEVPEGAQSVRTDRFFSSVKAFVTVGKPSSGAWAPRGYPVEVAPLSDPGAVKAGQALGLQTFVGGKPAAGAECVADREGTGPGHESAPADQPTATADAEGKAELKFPKAGVWLLQCRQQVETRGDPKADYATYRAYLVLEVQEPGL